MSVARRVATGAAAGAIGLGMMAWAYIFGGGAEPGALDRAGPVVLWALPTLKLVSNLAAACAIGALVLALFALPVGQPAHRRALKFAALSAAAWCCTGIVLGAVTFSLIANQPMLSEGFLRGYASFAAIEGPGRNSLIGVGLAGIVSLLCLRARSPGAVALTATLAFAGLVPLVLVSHASRGADHSESTTSVILHIGAASVWLGGLATLVLLRPSISADRLPAVVRRYSTLALVAFVVLGISGLFAAWVGLGSFGQLGTPYGGIVIVKTSAFVVLGIFGALQRLWVVKKLEGDPAGFRGRFTALVLAELAIMGAVSGLAAALARTPPPASPPAADVEPLPAPELWNFITQWEADPLWTVLCALGVFLYLAGVRRFRNDGGAWPVQRTAAWLLGMGLLFIVTNGGVHVYQGFLFTFHVLTQMLLTAVVPLLLVPAAPLTLAGYTIRPRTDGSFGGLELVDALRRPLAAAVGAPYFTVMLIAGSLVAFYYSPLLEYSAANQLGYAAVTLLSLTTGCLFAVALAGTARNTGEPKRDAQLLTVAAAAVLYGVYGAALGAQGQILERPWLSVVGNPWGSDPVTDAELARPIMWTVAAGSLTLAAAMVLRRHRTPEDPPSIRDNLAAPRPLV